MSAVPYSSARPRNRAARGRGQDQKNGLLRESSVRGSPSRMLGCRRTRDGASERERRELRHSFAYSAFIPAVFTTRVYLSRSARIAAASSFPSSQSGSRPAPASFWRMSVSSNAFFKESRILLSIAGGVPAGANTPYQYETMTFGNPCTESGASSGRLDEGFAPVTPSAFSWPDLTWGSPWKIGPQNIDTSPASTACIAGGAPLYGTCTRSIPASCLISSMHIRLGEASPDELNASSPGFAFAAAISCLIELTPMDGFTTNMAILSATAAIGARSLRGSYGALETTGAITVGKSGVNSRSEEHTSELQSQSNLVCRLLLEKKKKGSKAGFSTAQLASPIQQRATRHDS